MASHENLPPGDDRTAPMEGAGSGDRTVVLPQGNTESTVPMEGAGSNDADRTVVLPQGSAERTVPLPGAPGETVSAAGRLFSRKKRRDVNTVMEGLRVRQPQGEVAFSAGEEALAPLEESYDLGDAFAEGGQGILFRGFDRKLRRLVALKSMRPELTKNGYLRGLFLSEARVTAQLDHPAIVPIYTLNSDDRDGLHLAMKLINGRTFKTYLEQVCTHYRLDGVRSFDEKKALRYRLDIFLKVCDALEYAHSRNVMHCDLKPSNIMIGEYHEAYIMDWGIAHKIHSPEGSQEQPGGVCGTPQYLAPEVIRRQGRDQRADIFAMGAILFEAVMLKNAFSGDSVQEMLTNIQAGRTESFEHRFRAPVDADLKAIIRKALAHDPADRYQQISEFSGDLRRYLMGLEVSARPDNPAMKVVRWLYLHRRLTLTLALCALLAGAGAVAFASYREYRLSERQRIRDYALGVAYSQTTHAGYLLDEQFSKFELMTDTLAADIQFLLKYDPHQGKDIGNHAHGAWYSVPQLRREGSPGMVDAAFHRGTIDAGAIAYNVTADTDRETLMQRLEPISRFIPRLLQTILESPAGVKITDSNLEALKKNAFGAGTPIVRVVFGFPDGLFAAYPASRSFPEHYDPRTRIWYPPDGSWKGGQAVWSRPYIDSIPEIGLVLSCSVPLHVLNMRGSGVCAVDISISELIEELHNSGNSGNYVQEKAIIDNDGQVIVSTTKNFAEAVMHSYRRSDEKIVFRKLEDPVLLAAMKTRKFGVITTRGASGSEDVYTFCHIGSVNWFYIEKLDMKRLLEYSSSQPLQPLRH